MVYWYPDKGMAVLDHQMMVEYPGIVIGTIGDTAHAGEVSDHNPSKEAHDLGAVDASDFMIGPHFTTAQANAVVDTLVANRDPRIAYIIWQGRIISSTVSPWIWRKYNGSDQHVNHFHISVNDLHETDISEWKGITMTITPDDADVILDRMGARLRNAPADTGDVFVKAMRAVAWQYPNSFEVLNVSSKLDNLSAYIASKLSTPGTPVDGATIEQIKTAITEVINGTGLHVG